MSTLIDTGASEDLSLNADKTRVANSPNAAQVTLTRPAARSTKEKKYRDALTLRQRQTPSPLTPFVLALMQRQRYMDAEARKKKNRDTATFFQYYDCNEYGEFNDAGDWIETTDAEDEFAYSLPITPAHVDSAKTLLLKTALEYEYKPVNKSSVLDMQLAKMCEELAEEDMTRIFTDDLKGREILYLLLAGKSYRYIGWAPDPLEPETTDVSVYSRSEINIPAARVCGNEQCQTPLKDDDEVCPKCLGEKVVTVGGGTTGKVDATDKKIPLSENQLHIPNPLAIQHDLSKTKINFSAITERDTLSRAEAEFLYCQVLPENRNGISEEMKIVRELERARLRTNSTTHGNDASLLLDYLPWDDKELVERERTWFLPWQYANFMITEDHWYYTKQDGLFWCQDPKELPDNAMHVKNGTFLGDLFKDDGGMFVCTVDDTVVEINGAAGADHWIKLIFGMRPSNADGSGMQRLRPLADIVNDSTNLDFKVLMDDASPATFLDRKYMSHLAKVGEYNVVNGLKDGDTWDKVVFRLQGASAHPKLGAFSEMVQGIAQFVVGTFSSMGAGAPDVKASGTATGVVKMAEEAAGRFLEAILQTKTADIDSRYKVLNNRRRHSIPAQIDKLKKRFGADVTQRFMSGNLKQAVAITVKKGTDQPQSQAIKIAMVQAYSDTASAFGQHPQSVSIMQELAELMGLPMNVGIGMTDKQEAERRLGMLRELTEQFQGQPIQDPIARTQIAMQVIAATLARCEFEPPPEPPEEPEIIAPASGSMAPPAQPMPMGEPAEAGSAMVPPPMMPPPPPPRPETPALVMMQEHAVFLDSYRDWIHTEGSRCDNDVLKTAVQMMWKLHFEREKLKQIELVRIEGEKQMELQKMAMEMAPPQPSPEELAEVEAQKTKQAQEDQIAIEAAGRVAEEQTKDADFEREQRGKDEDLEREALRSELNSELADKEAKVTMK